MYVLLHTCIIMSSEPDAESWDYGMIIGVMAILFTLIGSLLVVFILDKLFNWGLMKTLRSRVRGKHIFMIQVHRLYFHTHMGMHHN